MQDVEGSENEATKTVEASLIAEETGFVQHAATATATVQQSTNPEPESVPALNSSCIVRVVIGASDAAMEDVVSNQNLGHIQAVHGFSVPAVLQQTQLVSEAYESTVDMEGIVGNISESKT